MSRLMIKVSTFHGDDEEPESLRVIDHNDAIHRQWLGKHCFWAFRNNRAVLTEPVESE